jgi:hypothetical protein
MHANLREIVPESRLEESASLCVERMTRFAQHRTHARGRFRGHWSGGSGRLHLELFLRLLFLLLASVAFAADLLWRYANQKLRVWHAHHLIGDPIRFML